MHYIAYSIHGLFTVIKPNFIYLQKHYRYIFLVTNNKWQEFPTFLLIYALKQHKISDTTKAALCNDNKKLKNNKHKINNDCLMKIKTNLFK